MIYHSVPGEQYNTVAVIYVIEKQTTGVHNRSFSLQVHNSKFLSNTPICEWNANSSAMLSCSGVIYLSDKIEVKLFGELVFANNSASALEIHSSEVYFAPQTKVTFENNTSNFRGAIAVYDCGLLRIDMHVTILFLSNSAKYKGGAIYVEKCGSNNQQTASLCFLQSNIQGEKFTFMEIQQVEYQMPFIQVQCCHVIHLVNQHFLTTHY